MKYVPLSQSSVRACSCLFFADLRHLENKVISDMSSQYDLQMHGSKAYGSKTPFGTTVLVQESD